MSYLKVWRRRKWHQEEEVTRRGKRRRKTNNTEQQMMSKYTTVFHTICKRLYYVIGIRYCILMKFDGILTLWKSTPYYRLRYIYEFFTGSAFTDSAFYRSLVKLSINIVKKPTSQQTSTVLQFQLVFEIQALGIGRQRLPCMKKNTHSLHLLSLRRGTPLRACRECIC